MLRWLWNAREKKTPPPGWLPSDQTPQRTEKVLLLLALEPRMVFDGALALQAAAGLSHTGTPDIAQPLEAGIPAVHIPEGLAAERASAQQEAASGAPHTAAEIAFVDGSLPDIGNLLASITPDADVYVLDPTKDGVDQIAGILNGAHDISAIHILSHGSEANLYIGTAKLNVQSMSTDYAGDLAAIGSALAPDAAILVYGCDFAKGADGAEAANALAAATGAHIAASVDTTGAGGDWIFEFETGRTGARSLISAQAQQNWDHTLALTAAGTETLVNQTTTGTQQTVTTSGKQIASDASGNYAVVWEDTSSGSSEIYARKYAADGTAATNAFLVNTTTGDTQDAPSIAMDASGNFVVVWKSGTQDGSGYGIYAQRYNASGVAQGGEFLVNTTTANDQISPAIAMNASGFASPGAARQDGSATASTGSAITRAALPRAANSWSTPTRLRISSRAPSPWTPKATSWSPGPAAATAPVMGFTGSSTTPGAGRTERNSWSTPPPPTISAGATWRWTPRAISSRPGFHGRRMAMPGGLTPRVSTHPACSKDRKLVSIPIQRPISLTVT
jgi:hypothetical protein